MIEVVCGVIRNQAGEFLVCQRCAGKHLGGLWEFPGGKVEDGEQSETALARELQEELGIVIKVEDPLKPVLWAYENVTILLKPYFCRIVSGEPVAIEHQELRWCALNEFSLLEWAAADEPILRELVVISS